MALDSVRRTPSDPSKAGTFPRGNFLRNSGDLLVSPNTKSLATVTWAPLYLAAMSAF